MGAAPESTRPPEPRLRSPLQARSRASLDRIVAATRELLEERTFDELTIGEIVRAARSSVGVFYARFRDKEALLDHLDELYAQETLASLRALAASAAPASLDERVATVVRFLVEFHRERRGLIRALVLHARLHPGGAFGERTSRINAEVELLVAFLCGTGEELSTSDPAVRFGFVLALAGVREAVLHPEGPASIAPPLDDEALAKEITRAWLGYLNRRA